MVLVTVSPVCYQLSGVTSLREHSVLQYPVSLGPFIVRDLSKSLVLFVTSELTFAHTQSISSSGFCTPPWTVLWSTLFTLPYGILLSILFTPPWTVL